MSGGLGLLWDKYNEVLETNPLPTKAVTSLVGFTIGDLLAQSFLGEKGAPIDVKRLLRCVRASMRAVDSIALGVWGVGCGSTDSGGVPGDRVDRSKPLV